jgi:protein-S-isoprenylcysteine O-methyltransferase Ste14
VRWQIESMVKENSPEIKSLRAVSFVVHATRGVIRNQTMRRKTMFAVLVIALVLLFSGSTFLASMLNPQEHPMRFVLFWFICAWLTLTTILLAIFDLLMVRLEARKAQRGLQEKFSQPKTPDSPRSTIDE